MDKIIKLIDEVENIYELRNIKQHLDSMLDYKESVQLASKISNSLSVKNLNKKQQKIVLKIKNIYKKHKSADHNTSTTIMFYIDDIKCIKYYSGTSGGETVHSFYINDIQIFSREPFSHPDTCYDDLDDEIKNKLSSFFSKYNLTIKECYDSISLVMHEAMSINSTN